MVGAHRLLQQPPERGEPVQGVSPRGALQVCGHFFQRLGRKGLRYEVSTKVLGLGSSAGSGPPALSYSLSFLEPVLFAVSDPVLIPSASPRLFH